MQRTVIAVVDATRARLFTYERAAEVGGIEEKLSERFDLVNPARHRTPAQLFSDTRTNTSRTGGKLYGLDDHRDAHMDAMDSEFASAVASAIEQAVRDTNAKRVIVCASPRMLGILRTTDLRRGGVVLDEVAHDYSKMSPHQLHDVLVERGLLPASPRRAALAARI
ncbi:MAG TPA: host attachment protein [Kofleriaceae bacterium]|nr:host attachment protein [Kofleriaceae bacterium]